MLHQLRGERYFLSIVQLAHGEVGEWLKPAVC